MPALRRLTTMLIALACLPATVAGTPLAIVDVTVIDGNGGPAVPNSTVLVDDGRITAIGGASQLEVPADAAVLGGRGRYLLPGFIDSNVHTSIYGNTSRRETVVRYGQRNAELILESAQRHLMHGVTTVRDSYGSLLPLIEVRDRIAAGEAVGARLLVAGNIVGWGGPFSITFSLMEESELTRFQEEWNDSIAQGAGEEMLDMGPEEVREAINAYLDKGPDFIKYGGTSHFRFPSLIGFAPRIQEIIVDETHQRGLIAETHATSPEALRIALEAGIDLIQHPEILSAPYPEELIEMIVERGVLCAMRSNTLAGEPWRQHLERKAAALEELADAPPPATRAEQRRRDERVGRLYELQRENAVRLIEAGCRVTIATDNYHGRAPEFRKQPKPVIQEAGIGSILAIEGLVELGMTPGEALVAATHNGALATGRAEELGTIEVGMIADLVLLEADPLEDIANIRRLSAVIAGGRRAALDQLPEAPLFYQPPERKPGAARPAPAPASASPTPAAGGESEADAEERRAISEIRESPLGALTIFLANGEIWRQLDSDNARVPLPEEDGPRYAVIEEGFLGSTRLTISGTGRWIRVRRIDEQQTPDR